MPVVIPELVYVVALFFAVCGYLVARGLLAGWTHSIGYVLQWLGRELRFSIPVPLKTIHVDLGGPFRAADAAVFTAIQNWATGAEIEIGYCLHGLARVAQLMSEAIDILGRETASTFDWFLHIKLRQLLKLVSLPVLLPLLIPKLIAAVLPHIKSGTVRIYHVVTHEVTHTATRVVVKTAAVAIPGAHSIPGLRKEVTGLTRRMARINTRLRRVEGLFAAGVLAAAIANVLGVATKCLRSGNIGRTARRICGMDTSLLNLLLQDGLAILGAVSVVEFAKDLQAIENEAIAVLGGLIKEWPS